MNQEGREKVLIIEDQPIIAADISAIVSNDGYFVTGTARTHEEALEKYKADPANVIVTDIQLLDGSSGIDAALDIKKLNRDVVVIFVTAFPERLLSGKRPEPTFLLTKPFQPETLLAAIAQAVSRHRPVDLQQEKQSGPLPDNSQRIRATLEVLENDPLGVRFFPVEGQLAIDSSGSASDIEAASRKEVIQLHDQIRRRSGAVAEIADGLRQQHGWEELEEAVRRFISVVDRPTIDIPNHIGELWSEAVELGSFLELDSRIRRERPLTNMAPLDPISQRALASLVRVAAPWVRLFPTARDLDDQSGSFLARSELFTAAVEVIDAAAEVELLSVSDRAILTGLIDAAHRGELQGHKAKSRSISTARNLTICALAGVSSFYGGAISNEFSAHSELTQKIGVLLANAAKPAEELLMDMAPDIKFALEFIRDELKSIPYNKITLPGVEEDKGERWLDDVKAYVEMIGESEFTLSDVYQYENSLKARHPKNNNVQAKIRQQLQVLRDQGLIEFTGRGTYRWVTKPTPPSTTAPARAPRG